MSGAASSHGVEVITFGCRLNAYESELIAAKAKAAGLADAVIINTCAVTAEAERQARQAIRKARRARPGARLIVTGCAAQIAPAKWAAMDEVDGVLGNAEKLEQGSYSPSPLGGEGKGVRAGPRHLGNGGPSPPDRKSTRLNSSH